MYNLEIILGFHEFGVGKPGTRSRPYYLRGTGLLKVKELQAYLALLHFALCASQALRFLKIEGLHQPCFGIIWQ